ncbi:MAG: hypothetical protein L0Y80_08185 [Ignavibacteriae bacterium]|nr:hypothetical protein [Ignavibacteriota bacterium]
MESLTTVRQPDKATMRIFVSLTLCLIVSLVIAGCSGIQLTSNLRQSPIQIDGKVGDWDRLPSYSAREGIRLSITNDREYFYILFATHQREVARQVVMRGFTLWFDPNGGSKKTIGLNYPLGVMEPGMRERMGDMDPSERTDIREDLMNRSLQEFEFLGPNENDRVRVSKNEGKGVEVHVSDESNLFVYEAKIPLIFSMQHPYAIETSTGSTIGLTIEVGSREMFMRRMGGMEGGRPGDGGGFSGGRGGRMPPGGGQRPSGTQRMQFEPIELTVRLAE